MVTCSSVAWRFLVAIAFQKVLTQFYRRSYSSFTV